MDSNKTSPAPIKYHFLSETAISLSTLSLSTDSSTLENVVKPPVSSRDRDIETSYEDVQNNVKFAEKPVYGYGDDVRLKDFPSSVSLEALRAFQNEYTGVTLEHVLNTMYRKEDDNPATVCMEGERFNLKLAKDLLKRISIDRRNYLEKKIEIAEHKELPKVKGVTEDEEPIYNPKWEKHVYRPPRVFEYAYSYNVNEGHIEFIDKCITPEPSPPPKESLNLPVFKNRYHDVTIPEVVVEEDPFAYFTFRKKPIAQYVLKQKPMPSFNYLTSREIKIIKNVWINAKKNTETFATLVILNCYKLKEHESKKRVSLNKVLQHKRLMSHGRMGMNFLSKVIQNLNEGSKSNELTYKAGKRHQKWNFRPMLYELIVNGFLLTLIDFINPRIVLEQVETYRKFLTILFDIFKNGMNWNKHHYGRKCTNTGYY